MEEFKNFLSRQAYEQLYALPLDRILLEVKLRIWLLHQDFGQADCQGQSDLKEFYEFWINRLLEGLPIGSVFGHEIGYAHLGNAEEIISSSGLDDELLKEEFVSLVFPFEMDSDRLINEGNSDSDDFDLNRDEEAISAIISSTLAQFSQPVTLADGRNLISVDFSQPITVLVKEFKTLVKSMKESSIELKSTKNAWGPDKLKEMKHERVFEIADALIVNRYSDMWPEQLQKSDLVSLIYADQPELNNEEFKSTFRKTHMEFAMSVFSRSGYSRLLALYKSIKEKSEE